MRYAIRNRLTLAFEYADKPRVCEPHVLAVRDERVDLFAYQVGGEGEGWKTFVQERSARLSGLVKALCSRFPRCASSDN